jgi:hypothetical protein
MAIESAIETIDKSDSIVVLWPERRADKTFENSGYRLSGSRKEMLQDALSSMLSVESPPPISMYRPYLIIICIRDEEAPVEISLVSGIGECRLNTVDPLKEIAMDGEKVGGSELINLEKNVSAVLRKDIFGREFVLRPKPVKLSKDH